MVNYSMDLLDISVGEEGVYIVAFGGKGGDRKEYKFSVRQGDIPVIEASPEFGEDIGSFGYSHKVYKAVSAFHEACEYVYGRPGVAGDSGRFSVDDSAASDVRSVEDSG